MNLECDPENEYMDAVYFCRVLFDDTELCPICQCDETEDGKVWNRYQIKCGHKFHTRCFRRWCSKKNCLNCAYCGNIPETQTSMYCSECDEYGHPFYTCPLIGKELKKQNRKLPIKHSEVKKSK